MTTTAPTNPTTPTAPASTPAASSTQTATQQGLDSLTDNFNTFLTLLTTQLQNQDPTAPLDSNQFTQQLVQMTGVEQQINTNALIQQLVNNSNGVGTAVGLIGKQVTATSSTANLNGGQAQWGYTLPSGVADLKVTVADPNGVIVDVAAPTDLSAGNKSFTWNGKNLAGTQLPDGGPYTLTVTASDSAGNALTTSTFVQGVVTGVTQANGAASVVINGGSVPWTNVTNVVNQASSGTGS
ncbi:flagellar hook capping FlgD N-terminal domain-containing protein [Phenylobacterium sp.]|uniref:flagellar hook assembly protein FlgD n=1 Tax=Phenylobacterium sp. TaxID=1871053 RepID=UPI0011FA3840|nr:flagellar hook capping FlgD N-terminal domain-containing protein [Phenylobacterium sp.]THD64046.1 MAG: hypothetical protein E8A49_03350 [Phenylobacterium sp.]